MRDAFDTAREIAWEVRGVNAAVARYREDAATKSLDQLPGGRRLLAQLVKPLEAQISAAQADALQQMARVGSRRPGYVAVCQLLPALPQAVIVLNHALRVCEQVWINGVRNQLVGVLGLGLGMVASVREQLEFEAWSKAERAKTRAGRAEGERDPYLAFKVTYPNATVRLWKKWAQRLELLRKQDWPLLAVEVPYGGWLIEQLLTACPDHFEAFDQPLTGMAKLSSIRLTPAAREIVKAVGADAELGRPQLYPMLVPPNPWRYEKLETRS